MPKRNPRKPIFQPATNTYLIPLTKGYFSEVDPEDVDLACLCWSSRETKTGGAYAHRGRQANGKVGYCMHSVILERVLGRPLVKGEKCDHIDKNPCNNRRGNLRVTNSYGNMQNRGVLSSNTSGYKGVRWDKKQKKWVASIQANKVRYYLGASDDPVEAYGWYCEAAIELHGEYARLE